MNTSPPLRTILLVEDDDQVRGLVRTLLTTDGFHVIEARTGGEGVRLAQQYDGSIDLLLSDMLLPEVSGYDIAAQMKARYPDMKVILMTGWVEGEIVQRCVAELGAAFLDKPFVPARLRELVREMLPAETGVGSRDS
jgi:two-component system, cell cycle sensor histidine kinase and response regulator CckA